MHHVLSQNSIYLAQLGFPKWGLKEVTVLAEGGRQLALTFLGGVAVAWGSDMCT